MTNCHDGGMDLVSEAWRWLGREVVHFGLRWLVVGALAVPGVLLFGRGYKRRIAALEDSKKKPTTVNIHDNFGNVIVGDDGLYHAPFEGRGEISSPRPIRAFPLGAAASARLPTARVALAPTPDCSGDGSKSDDLYQPALSETHCRLASATARPSHCEESLRGD